MSRDEAKVATEAMPQEFEQLIDITAPHAVLARVEHEALSGFTLSSGVTCCMVETPENEDHSFINKCIHMSHSWGEVASDQMVYMQYVRSKKIGKNNHYNVELGVIVTTKNELEKHSLDYFDCDHPSCSPEKCLLVLMYKFKYTEGLLLRIAELGVSPLLWGHKVMKHTNAAILTRFYNRYGTMLVTADAAHIATKLLFDVTPEARMLSKQLPRNEDPDSDEYGILDEGIACKQALGKMVRYYRSHNVLQSVSAEQLIAARSRLLEAKPVRRVVAPLDDERLTYRA